MNNRRLTIFAFVAGVVLAGLLMTGPPTAMAQTLDPATLQIGSGVTGCVSTGGCNNTGSSPNLLGGSASVDIFNNQGGTSNTISSGNLLLILAVPTGSTPSTSITEKDYNAAGTLTATGAATLTTTKTGFVNTLASGTDVYSFLSLNDGDNSNNVTNLIGTTTGGVLTPSPSNVTDTKSFTLYEYTMTGSSLVNQGFSLFTFGSTLPLGTYAVGYGCDTTLATIGSTTGCLKSGSTTKFDNGETYSTPFTRAGLIDSAPEASAVTLTSLVLLAFGALVLRARRELA